VWADASVKLLLSDGTRLFELRQSAAVACRAGEAELRQSFTLAVGRGDWARLALSVQLFLHDAEGHETRVGAAELGDAAPSAAGRTHWARMRRQRGLASAAWHALQRRAAEGTESPLDSSTSVIGCE